jgi:hypothetical protein
MSFVEAPPPVPGGVARLRCARESVGLAEPMAGTAGEHRAWLLLEQPGPWGDPALTGSRLDPVVGEALADAAEELELRALLIRRPGRYPAGPLRPWAFLAWTDDVGGGPWIEARQLDDPSDILAADLEALAAGRRPRFGEPWMRPIYLVCTNGRVDACCAEYGRRTAAALSAERPAETWESTHVGGDRFAANIVCLPHGIHYGHVQPEDAGRIARAYEAGALDLAHLRGRASRSMAVQAAEWFARRRTGLVGLDDLRVAEAAENADGTRGSVVFATVDGGAVSVEVSEGLADVARVTSCADAEPDRPAEWRLDAMTVAP